jgi:hypothetical protein
MPEQVTKEKKLEGLSKRETYELWLELGNLFHVLSNHCDADRGAEMLEPIIDRLQERCS